MTRSHIQKILRNHKFKKKNIRTSKFGRLQDTRSTYKNQLLYTVIDNLKFKNTVSFMIASKNIKYSGISLTK